MPIPVENGLKEGSKQSCLFFDLVIGEIVRILDTCHILGLRNDPASLLPRQINRIIAYADDLTLMTESRATMIAIISDLVSITACFGLKVNAGKSYWLYNNWSNHQPETSELLVLHDTQNLQIAYSERALFLGFGILSNKGINIGQHLSAISRGTKAPSFASCDASATSSKAT